MRNCVFVYDDRHMGSLHISPSTSAPKGSKVRVSAQAFSYHLKETQLQDWDANVESFLQIRVAIIF